MTLDGEIIQALGAGLWLDFVSGYNLRDDADELAMRASAVRSHNAGLIDLLAAIDGFDDDGDSFRFYEIQQFYSATLPQLDAEPAAMLKAVRRLVEEGGPNRDGGFIALPFRDWCKSLGRAAANRGALNVHSFDSFEHQLLTKHRARFDTLAVEWFISGDRALGEAVMALVRKVHGAPMVLRPDLAPFGYGPAKLIFLARKAVGYLFSTPITAASLLLAIMRTGVADAVKGATELLFDPLLVSYSGELGDHLREVVKDTDDPATPHVEAALQQLETYLEGLRAVGRVKALDPSERERMIEWRRRQQEMEEAMKAGEKDSIFSQLATKVVLLYGNRSITYVPPYGDEPGPERRLVTEMHSHHHSHEYARMGARGRECRGAVPCERDDDAPRLAFAEGESRQNDPGR